MHRESDFSPHHAVPPPFPRGHRAHESESRAVVDAAGYVCRIFVVVASLSAVIAAIALLIADILR